MKSPVNYRRNRKSTGKKRPAAVVFEELVSGTTNEGLVLKEVATAYGLKQQTLSRMSGFSLRAVAHWLAGQAPGDAARMRLTELQRLLQAVSVVVEPAALEDWLQKPNPAFQNSTPLQVIERGETDRLWRMLYELGSGEPA